MKKIITLTNKKKYLLLLPIILIAAFLIFRSSDAELETFTVKSDNFLQQVSVSGKVVPAQNVDITPAESGRVAGVYVKVGDEVTAGSRLISLDTASLQASLDSAKSDVDLKKLQIKNEGNSLEKVTAEQDTLVESAYRTMLSEGLVAVPASSQYEATPPQITGRYFGKEGIYKIIIEETPTGSGNHMLRTFNVERSEPVEILENEPTRLGTQGLFISFSSDLDLYDDTIWYVSIPNTKSTDYTENYNTYKKALEARNRAILDAESNLTEENGISILSAELAQAEARVRSIQADIENRILRAPFSGLITRVDAKVGESISSGIEAVSMISNGTFQIESFIPEINVALLKIGDKAVVTLDAYGAEPFLARVISIDPAETLQDGVSTYKAVLQFETPDPRIKSGMTANVVITTMEKANTLAVPQGIIILRNGKKFVTVINGEKKEEREITTGAISSLGQIEITGGLEEGEKVLITE